MLGVARTAPSFFGPRLGNFAMGAFGQRSQAEARNFGAAIDADAHPECAEAAVGIDVEIFVAIQARIILLADAKDRAERRSIKRDPHDAAVSVAGEHHAGAQMTRIERGIGIVREHDRAASLARRRLNAREARRAATTDRRCRR